VNLHTQSWWQKQAPDKHLPASSIRHNTRAPGRTCSWNRIWPAGRVWQPRRFGWCCQGIEWCVGWSSACRFSLQSISEP